MFAGVPEASQSHIGLLTAQAMMISFCLLQLLTFMQWCLDLHVHFGQLCTWRHDSESICTNHSSWHCVTCHSWDFKAYTCADGITFGSVEARLRATAQRLGINMTEHPRPPFNLISANTSVKFDGIERPARVYPWGQVDVTDCAWSDYMFLK